MFMAYPQVDLVVITPPGLREAADSLAAIHFAEGIECGGARAFFHL